MLLTKLGTKIDPPLKSGDRVHMKRYTVEKTSVRFMPEFRWRWFTQTMTLFRLWLHSTVVNWPVWCRCRWTFRWRNGCVAFSHNQKNQWKLHDISCCIRMPAYSNWGFCWVRAKSGLHWRPRRVWKVCPRPAALGNRNWWTWKVGRVWHGSSPSTCRGPRKTGCLLHD